MKIWFGKHSGKDISELDSSYLLWIIEYCNNASWILIQECKRELSERLKLDFVSPPMPLTQKEIIDAFKRKLLDDYYYMGNSEEVCREIAKGEFSWSPPQKNETKEIAQIVFELIGKIVQDKINQQLP